MMTIFLSLLCLNFASSFRGPHHPRSSDISHHHYTPQAQIKLTHDEQLLHDAEHLKEDLGPLADKLDLSKMSKQELEFYYFKLHDTDNNAKLDGLELYHALQHISHGHHHIEDNSVGQATDPMSNEILEDDFDIEGMIDQVLEQDDLNNDGYLGYAEFVHSRQRNEHPHSSILWETKAKLSDSNKK